MRAKPSASMSWHLNACWNVEERGSLLALGSSQTGWFDDLRLEEIAQ